MAKTLLLADDSVTIQKVVNISFASEDVKLITVDNGDDAIERAREMRPDLILADVVMPGKSGYEVCEAIKADPALAHIPVLLLTGTFEAFDEAQAARVGAAGHVAKPFEAQTLVDRVNELLAAAPSPPSPTESAPATQPPSEAPTNSNDDSFDFFDDDLGDIGTSTADILPDALSVDADDSAFSFGESALPELERDTKPKPDARPADRTVAILPGDDAPGLRLDATRTAAEVPPTALSADLEDRGYGDPAAELLPGLAADADDSFATADQTGVEDEPFDFSFDRDEPAEASRIPLHVESDDVAQATVLDPNGASGYDVSSSDLGDSFVGIEPIASIATMMDAPGDEPFGSSLDLETDEPLAIAMEAPGDFDDAPIATRLDESFSAPGRDVTAVADATEFLDIDALDADESFARIESDDAASDDPLFGSPPSQGEVARPLPADDAARTDSVLAEIAPQLRQQIHDTLEKIAWESFGEVTEKIVSDVVDRVEKVAWEVIPQLTETLIKAEIRRMKGESDD